MQKQRGAADLSSFRITKLDQNHETGLTQVKLEQFVGEYVIERAGLNLFFREGHLWSINGRIWNTDVLRKPDAVTAKTLRAYMRVVEPRLAQSLAESKTYDPETDRFQLTATADSTNHIFDVERCVLVGMSSAIQHAPSNVAATINVHDYDESFLPSPQDTKFVQSTVARDQIAGMCEFSAYEVDGWPGEPVPLPWTSNMRRGYALERIDDTTETKSFYPGVQS